MRFDLFSSGRLYAALKAAKYPDLPAERTLRDWIKNDSAPEGARQFVARLVEVPGTTKEAVPHWAERLEAKVDGLYELNVRPAPDLEAWAERIAARLAVLPSQSGEASVDPPAESAPGTAARRGPEPS